MRSDEFWILSALIYVFIVSAIIVIGLVKKSKKNKITILTDNCTGCPFHVNDISGLHFCKLDMIQHDGRILKWVSEKSLKETCPVKGKLKISIEQQ